MVTELRWGCCVLSTSPSLSTMTSGLQGVRAVTTSITKEAESQRSTQRAPQGHRQLPMTCDTTLFSFLSCSAPPRAEVLRSSSPAPGSLTLASSEPLWPLSFPSLVPTSDSSPPWTAVLTSGSCLERVLLCAPPALSFVGGVGSAHVLSLRLGF